MPKLKSKAGPAAIITGSAKRLGREMALHLSDLGYDIVLHYHRSEKEAHSTAAEIQKRGRQCLPIRADLNNPDELKMICAESVRHFKNLSLLINNASEFKPSKLFSKAIPRLKRDIDIHLLAPYHLMREFTRLIPEGHIINILDAAISGNRQTHSPYLIAKKALASLTQLAALELAPRYRVNGIAPGAILKPPKTGKDYMERIAKRIPLQRQGHPRHIIKALDYLLSNDFVTGQILFVDGGESLI